MALDDINAANRKGRVRGDTARSRTRHGHFRASWTIQSGKTRSLVSAVALRARGATTGGGAVVSAVRWSRRCRQPADLGVYWLVSGGVLDSFECGRLQFAHNSNRVLIPLGWHGSGAAASAGPINPETEPTRIDPNPAAKATLTASHGRMAAPPSGPPLCTRPDVELRQVGARPARHDLHLPASPVAAVASAAA